jgi:hypothetical protein
MIRMAIEPLPYKKGLCRGVNRTQESYPTTIFFSKCARLVETD